MSGLSRQQSFKGEGNVIEADAVRLITQKWIKNQMRLRESEFSRPIPINIFCGTWNVNNKTLADVGLDEWLFPAGQPDIDIFALGFQEIVELNPMNVSIDGSKSQARSIYWKEQIAASFEKNGKCYTLLSSKYLVGILLCVYVDENLLKHIRDVRITTAAVGVMGVMGNKGGVTCSFKIYGTLVSIVCAHLAAKRDNVTGRNEDFYSIIDKTVLYHDDTKSTINSEDTNTSTTTSSITSSIDDVTPLAILEHDIIIWIGDLNYRIDESLSTDQVFDKVTEGDLSTLLDNDQLIMERAKGTVFVGFEEGTITFPPTYKFQQGTDIYERRKEKKLRAPAWCDRVLWRSNVGQGRVNLISYTSAPLLPSDHKPVAALLNLFVREIDVEKEAKVRLDIKHKLDKWENNSTPKVQLSWTSSTGDGKIQSLEEVGNNLCTADLGMLKYQERSHVILRIKNIGTALVHWYMVPKAIPDHDNHTTTAAASSNSSSSSPTTSLADINWVSLNPMMGVVMPEEVSEVQVIGQVNQLLLKILRQQDPKTLIYALEDILILRVDKGRDFFIPVKMSVESDSNTDTMLTNESEIPPSSSSPTPSPDQQNNESTPMATITPNNADNDMSYLPSSSSLTSTTTGTTGSVRTRSNSTTPTTGITTTRSRGASFTAIMINSHPPPPNVTTEVMNPIPPPPHFISPLDIVEEEKERKDENGVNNNMALLLIRERANKTFQSIRAKSVVAGEKITEKTKEVKLTAEDNFKNVTEKAAAGWRSVTAAAQRIRIVPPTTTSTTINSQKEGSSTSNITDEMKPVVTSDEEKLEIPGIESLSPDKKIEQQQNIPNESEEEDEDCVAAV